MTIASTQVSCLAPVLEACCPRGNSSKLRLTESCVEVPAAPIGQQLVRPRGCCCSFTLNDPVSLSSCLMQLVAASGDLPAADVLAVTANAADRLRSYLSRQHHALPGRVQWIHFGFTPARGDSPAEADVIFEVAPR